MPVNIKYCRDCKWSWWVNKKSNPLSDIPGTLGLPETTYCTHPLLLKENADVLAANPTSYQYSGVVASTERSKKFFGACGMSGYLWEPKEEEKL